MIAGNGLRPEIWDEFTDAVRHRPGVRVLRRQRGQHRVRQHLQHRQEHRHLPDAGGVRGVRRRDRRAEARRGRPGAQGASRRAGPADRPRSAASSRSTATPTRRPREKKLVRDAFKEGDVWFNTGDLMRSQGFGHAAFTDRLGDTFRWKGENVATTQVEAAVSTDPQIEEATVFGVEVPDTGGRAGMAAIQLKDGEEFDGKALAKAVYEQLPGLRRAAVRAGRRGAGAHVDVQEPEGRPAQAGLRRQHGEGDETTSRTRLRAGRPRRGLCASSTTSTPTRWRTASSPSSDFGRRTQAECADVRAAADHRPSEQQHH